MYNESVKFYKLLTEFSYKTKQKVASSDYYKYKYTLDNLINYLMDSLDELGVSYKDFDILELGINYNPATYTDIFSSNSEFRNKLEIWNNSAIDKKDISDLEVDLVYIMSVTEEPKLRANLKSLISPLVLNKLSALHKPQVGIGSTDISYAVLENYKDLLIKIHSRDLVTKGVSELKVLTITGLVLTKMGILSPLVNSNLSKKLSKIEGFYGETVIKLASQLVKSSDELLSKYNRISIEGSLLLAKLIPYVEDINPIMADVIKTSFTDDHFKLIQDLDIYKDVILNRRQFPNSSHKEEVKRLNKKVSEEETKYLH